MTPLTTDHVSVKRFPRWLPQFGLRTVLVLVLVAGVASAWLANRLKGKRLEEEALRGIENSWPEYDFGLSGDAKPTGPEWVRAILGKTVFNDLVGMHLPGKITPSDVTLLKQVPYLSMVAFDGPDFTDAGLEAISALGTLEELWVNNATLTASGLGHLRNLHELRLLSLDNCSEISTDLEFLDGLPHLERLDLLWFVPTNDGWARLKNLSTLRDLHLMSVRRDISGLSGLTQLRKLDLDCIGLCDSDLQYLENLTSLERLYLDGAYITDAGLDHLVNLKGLKSLAISRSQITDKGRKRLRHALPDCQF